MIFFLEIVIDENFRRNLKRRVIKFFYASLIVTTAAVFTAAPFIAL